LGFGVSDDIKVMESIQKTLSNKNCTFMIDINHAYGVTEALELGYALEDFNLRWYEEPVVPENIQGYAYLRNKLKIPIAGGENEHTLYGFKDLFKLGCIDIAQPDIGSCGGITGAKHISILAQSFGIEVNPHVWGSAVAQSASIHFIASLPATNHSLFTRQPILEYDQSDHPFRQKLLKNPIKMNKGYVIVQESPGLGIEVNKEIINKYKIN
ncbi:MAG: mandelate racemase/muconate lactonizing enzyme family protein, partial [Alphaproteobacteria bacterium TMED54]